MDSCHLTAVGLECVLCPLHQELSASIHLETPLVPCTWLLCLPGELLALPSVQGTVEGRMFMIQGELAMRL